jgi:hypothetical protein
MGKLMLELQRDQATPLLLPRAELLSTAPAPQPAAAAASAPAAPQGTEVVSQAQAQQAIATPAVDVPANGQASAPPSLLLAASNSTQAVPRRAATTPAAPLVWGRWVYAAVPGDQMSTVRSLAAANREQVAANDYYALYRLPESAGLPNAAVGPVAFSLMQAQAHLVSAGGILPAHVNSGQLVIDFNARSFETALSLFAAASGPVDLQARGSIGIDGRFTSQDHAVRIQGAYSATSAEAAYLFEKTLPQGILTGITQWR